MYMKDVSKMYFLPTIKWEQSLRKTSGDTDTGPWTDRSRLLGKLTENNTDIGSLNLPSFGD